jgi:hypothetical protein
MAEIIQGVSYKSVASNPDLSIDTFELIPKDSNGNLFSEVTIDCDTSLGNIIVILPSIVSLNGNWNISINIINSVTTSYRINIITSESDLIGSTNSINLDNTNSNVILTPVSSTVWSAILTA